MREAVKGINKSLKGRVANLRRSSAQLQDRFDRVSARLANDAISFDAKVAEVNAEVLDIQQAVVNAKASYDNTVKRLQADVAQVGNDLKTMRKDRLEQRRMLLAEVEQQKERVAELESYLSAYKELDETAKGLRDQIEKRAAKEADTPDVNKLLPKSAKDAMGKRTVAEQQALESYGMGEGVREVNVPVRVGEEVEVATSKRLAVDDKAAGSLYRNTMDSVGKFIDDESVEQLERLGALVDGVYVSSKRFTQSQLDEAEDAAMKLVSNLEKAKIKLNLALDRKARGLSAERLPSGRWKPNTSTSDSAIRGLENDVALLENQVKNAYDRVEEISSVVGRQQGVPSELTFEQILPTQRGQAGTRVQSGVVGGETQVSTAGFKENLSAVAQQGSAREQAQKQIAAAVRQVTNDAYQRVLAETGSEIAAKDYAELIFRTFKAMETRARTLGVAGADQFAGPGGAAYVIAAQDSLQSALKKSRISLDYSRRLRLVEAELASSGKKLNPQQMEAVQHAVMAEVMRSEKRSLQVARKKAADSIDAYLTNLDEAVDANIKKTKAYALAEQEADRTWGTVEVLLDTMFSADNGLAVDFMISPTNIRGVARDSAELFAQEGVNPGYSISQGRKAAKQARSRAFNEASREAEVDIARALFAYDTRTVKIKVNGEWRDVPQSAKEFIKNGGMKKFFKNISDNAPKPTQPGEQTWKAAGERAWKDLIIEVRMGDFAKATPEARTASRAQKSFSLAERAAREQISQLDDEIRMIDKTLDRLVPKSVKPTAKSNLQQVDELLETAAVYREKAASLPGRSEQKKRLAETWQLLEDAANYRREFGVPARAPRMTPEDIMNGRSPLQYSTTVKSKRLATLGAQLLKVEQKMSDVLNDGVLAYAVKDVPGDSSIFDKAKNYVAAIDEELKTLKDRASRVSGQQSKDVTDYAKKLRAERKALVDALDQSTPLEDYVMSAKTILADKKDQVKRLTGATDQEADLAAAQAKLNARLNTLNSPEGIDGAERIASSVGAIGDIMEAELRARVGVMREAYDATVTAVRDADAAIEASRSQIESFIPAIEELLKNTVKVPKRAGEEQIQEIFEWIQEAYAMLDPEGLASRLGMMPKDMVPEAIADTSKLYGMGVKASELISYLQKFPNDKDARVALSLVYRAHEDAAKLMVLAAERSPIEQALKSAKSKELVTSFKIALRDGFKEIASTGVYIPAEMENMVRRVIEIDNRDVAGMLKALNKYTEVWKAVKTTSPRFHIRNALSATVMNYVAGVSTKNMMRGVDFYKAYLRNPRNWLNDIPAEFRPYAQQALDAVFAAGGGQYQEITNAATSLSNRGVFKLSRNVGSAVEGSVRMGQALDSILPQELGGKGLGFDLAVGQIEKFHFNYSKLSQFDRNAKAMIPFWTFMSRNLPLQLEQMWLSPRTYAIYNSLARNLNANEEGDVVPGWIKEGEGFKLPFGDNLYATPDIGYTQVQRDIEMLKDPIRFAQNLNPIPKTALEWWANKQFYQDIPLDDDQYVPLQGAGRLLQPLLSLTGGAESMGGQTFGTERDVYALGNIIPGYSEIERFISPSTERSKERQGQNIFSFLTGSPVTKVTDRQIRAEQTREKFQNRSDKAKREALRRALRESK